MGARGAASVDRGTPGDPDHGVSGSAQAFRNSDSRLQWTVQGDVPVLLLAVDGHGLAPGLRGDWRAGTRRSGTPPR
jgi:hypothetical protein